MLNALIPPMMMTHAVIFQLVLFRLVAFCVIVPYLGSKSIPRRYALFFAAGFALVVTPRLMELQPVILESIDVNGAILQNMLVGFLYGASLLLVFEIIGIVGIMIAYASGLGMLQMLDPSGSGNSSIITNVLNITFGLVFISSGGLLVFVDFITHSFGSFPVGGFELDALTFKLFVYEFGNVFKTGIMIAIPFTGCALLLNVALAVVSKSAPAMNLFTIGFPLSVLLGLLTLGAVMPFLLADLNTYVLSLSESYKSFL